MADDTGLKSSYELAMERLKKKDADAGVEAVSLTDEQKAAIAEVRQMYQAKGAEREILHQAALRKAASHEEVEQLNEALRRDTERIAGERDRKIAAIREGR
jgi:DNA-binding MarR family transcriptional regulator